MITNSYFMKIFLNTFLIFFVLFKTVTAQNVGINSSGAVPDNSAMLDVVSTDKGILIPRVNITDLNTAAPTTAPANSLLVFNTNITSGEGYYFWDGTKWVKLLDSNSNSDQDWHEVGGTSAPNDINDNIFTQGNVGIGLNNPSYSLDVNNFSFKVGNTDDGGTVKTSYLGSSAGFEFIEFDDPFIIRGIQSGFNDGDTAFFSFYRENIGIGTNFPSENLHINGTVRIQDGTEGAGKILTSDANGVASWETPSTSILLPVVYPNGTTQANTFFTSMGTHHSVATFTAPADGTYMICASLTVTISGGDYGDLASFGSNSQTLLRMTDGGYSVSEEHLSEDPTKQFSMSYIFNLTAGQVVTLSIHQQNATSLGFSNLDMKAVKF